MWTYIEELQLQQSFPQMLAGSVVLWILQKTLTLLLIALSHVFQSVVHIALGHAIFGGWHVDRYSS